MSFDLILRTEYFIRQLIAINANSNNYLLSQQNNRRFGKTFLIILDVFLQFHKFYSKVNK